MWGGGGSGNNALEAWGVEKSHLTEMIRGEGCVQIHLFVGPNLSAFSYMGFLTYGKDWNRVASQDDIKDPNNVV